MGRWTLLFFQSENSMDSSPWIELLGNMCWTSRLSHQRRTVTVTLNHLLEGLPQPSDADRCVGRFHLCVQADTAVGQRTSVSSPGLEGLQAELYITSGDGWVLLCFRGCTSSLMLLSHHCTVLPLPPKQRDLTLLQNCSVITFLFIEFNFPSMLSNKFRNVLNLKVYLCWTSYFSRGI